MNVVNCNFKRCNNFVVNCTCIDYYILIKWRKE
nr:MAG TPA: hypothetical protein [Caudoviricetes sp.]